MADRALRLQEALSAPGSRKVLTPLLSQSRANPDSMRLANANKVLGKSGGSVFTE
jgi:hypothetical protein